jgi:hypothetical protein
MRNFFALSAWLLATIPLVGSTGDIGFSPPNTNSEEVVNIDDVRDRRHLIVGGEDVDIGEYPYFGKPLLPVVFHLWIRRLWQNKFIH